MKKPTIGKLTSTKVGGLANGSRSVAHVKEGIIYRAPHMKIPYEQKKRMDTGLM